MKNKISVLLIADKRGYITDRIAETWKKYSPEIRFDILHSDVNHPFLYCSRSNKYDMVHWLDPLSFQIHGNAILRPQTVVVHHLTEQEIKAFLPQLNFSDCVTTTSVRWKLRLESMLNREVFLIPYTIDTKTFRIFENRLGIRHNSGISDHEFVIGFVGMASSNAFGRKGLDLLKATLILARKKWSEICVVLSGKGWELLKREIEREGIRVVYCEFANTLETASVYPLMDILIVTSKEEGGPCTILEAMASGVPVVTSDVGHVPEVIRDGETGLICKSRKPEEYIEKMSLIKGNKEIARKIAVDARSFVECERDDQYVFSKIDYFRIYQIACARFRMRMKNEKTLRSMALSYLGFRYLARRVLNLIIPERRTEG